MEPYSKSTTRRRKAQAKAALSTTLHDVTVALDAVTQVVEKQPASKKLTTAYRNKELYEAFNLRPPPLQPDSDLGREIGRPRGSACLNCCS